jgi:predicted DNA-binding protein
VQLSILISEEAKDKLKQLATAEEKPLAGIVEQLIIDHHKDMML